VAADVGHVNTKSTVREFDGGNGMHHTMAYAIRSLVTRQALKVSPLA
jgi:hypothetical protein